jgi:ABC-type transport system, involved in lipoprotein release, permease component
MKFLQAVKLALGGIGSNKMRSFLTMLGVIIGVAAVITLVSVGTGATSNVTKQIEAMGSNLITINLRGRGNGGTMSLESIMNLTQKPGVGAVAPSITGSVTVKYNEKDYSTTLEGTTPEYEDIRSYHAQLGRFLTQSDIDYGQQVVLLGVTVANQLSMGRNSVGSTVKINGYDFKVVGLLEEKGGTAMGSNDDRIIIPITTAEKILQNRTIRTVYAKASNPDSVNMAVTELKSYFTRVFNDENAFTVFNQQDALSTLNSATQTLTLLLGAIAGISLLVGGIGIMNIMLVSVTERTREIGIRKAIGAKRKNILSQFLIEAMALSGTGGLLGIAIGIGLTSLIGKLMKISAQVSPQIIMISFMFSLIVGIAFGLYPANKASKLNPIEALRFE